MLVILDFERLGLYEKWQRVVQDLVIEVNQTGTELVKVNPVEKCL